MDVPITVPEAVLGAAVEVPTPHGKVKLKVPAGTRGGEKLRLRGKGAARADRAPGDLFVILQVRAPDKLGDAKAVSELENYYSNVRADLRL
jgi:curved DNA-binding protein